MLNDFQRTNFRLSRTETEHAILFWPAIYFAWPLSQIAFLFLFAQACMHGAWSRDPIHHAQHRCSLFLFETHFAKKHNNKTISVTNTERERKKRNIIIMVFHRNRWFFSGLKHTCVYNWKCIQAPQALLRNAQKMGE